MGNPVTRGMSEFYEIAMEETDIQYFHEFAPGGGRSAEDLFRAGMAAVEYETRADYFELIVDEYPESQYAAKSLFMLANLQIDRYGDIVRAEILLRQLVSDYPDSEMIEQAEYMIENLHRQEFRTPKSIEDLRN